MSLIFKDSESSIILYSSLVYIPLGVFLYLQNMSLLFPIFFIIIGISAFLHHLFPKFFLFRFFDWTLSFVLVLFVFTTYKISVLSLLLAVFSLIVWIASLYFFHKSHNVKYYNLTHSAWHVLSGLLLCLMII